MKKLLPVIFVFIFSQFAFSQAYYINTVAGDFTSGGFSGDNGLATAAALQYPVNFALSGSQGEIYIPDAFNERIRLVNSNGVIATIAGNGIAAFSGDGGQASAAEFYSPYGVALDNSGNIYIADWLNYRIRMINTNGIISTVAGNGIQGYWGDGAPATRAEINQASAVLVDALGNIYLTDDRNNRIRKISTNGIISTVAGNGVAGYSGDGVPATATSINWPSTLSFDATGNLYFTDEFNNRVRMINTSGIISTVAGNGIAAFSGDGGLATAAEFDNPAGICLDAAGNLFICDFSNERIRMVNTNGIVSTIAGTGAVGFSGDGGMATSAMLDGPISNKIDQLGNIYFSDNNNNRVRKLSPVFNSVINGTEPKCHGGCNGTATATPTSGIPPFTYSWSTIPVQTNQTATGLCAGTYTCTLKDFYGNTLSDTITITQPAVLNLQVAPLTHSVCFGSNINLIASGASSYQWSPPLGLSCTNCPNPIASPTITTQYFITATDTAGCQDSITYTLNVITNPVAAIRGENVCIGSSATLAASGGGSYAWNTGETSSSISVSPLVTTVYSVLVTQNGCTDSAFWSVFVNPLPVINLCCDSTIMPSQNVHLYANGTGPYTWLPTAGLNCDNCPNPIAAPLQTTTYTLTVKSDSGCFSEEAVTIDVNCGEVFVPNAFSPNGDGQNDMLYVRGPCIRAMDFLVFDRWGNEIFHSQNIDAGWDGTFKGHPMNTGTYVYYLTGTLIDGTEIEKKGNVALVR